MPGVLRCRGSLSSFRASVGIVGPALVAWIGSADAASPPPIRISVAGPESLVPACVTPERLMTFLTSRNPRLDARYKDLARLYKQHGEAWRVRWDYAFYQMAVETNYLLFQRGDGRSGDVNPKQYNFAGLGTTGGGVPGDAYPDATTGVLAQIQHLVVYSGERIDRPIGARTQLKQDDIISASAAVSRHRPVTFQDLSGRWAVDRGYGRSIESIADRFRAMFCTGGGIVTADGEPRTLQPPAPQLATRQVWTATVAAQRREPAAVAPRVIPPGASQLGIGFAAPAPVRVTEAGPAAGCTVQTASFGGRKAVLIQAIVDGEQQLTVLQVLDGFEGSMTESFMQTYAPGGTTVAEFGSRQAALDHAQQICRTETTRAPSSR